MTHEMWCYVWDYAPHMPWSGNVYTHVKAD
jgi:hypothetical protein